MDDKYENPPPRGYSIPTIDLDAQTAHQVVVDRVDEPDIEPWVAYLLLDRRLISSADNAVMGQGIVKKHSANPLFGEDLPWETGMSHMYATIACGGCGKGIDCRNRKECQRRHAGRPVISVGRKDDGKYENGSCHSAVCGGSLFGHESECAGEDNDSD